MSRPVTEDETRILRVREIMSDVNRMVTSTDKFDAVHPGRWRSKRTGLEFETQYVHGQGTLRVYGENEREIGHTYEVAGKPGELAGFLAVFPELFKSLTSTRCVVVA